ncbi:tetratricopeptide repeat protein [Anabaena azotica]|uniref:Tetratricopeptide repeat protein n=1 Tax=Anabaena azotica FACHB-119 TaxID=947527 RepID=A0ABR8D0L6_9NOST|nr:tetratricopeptide repeat protein [Anabaena azotica]MBD2500472.1 tetratricopeptide repeat protein [Anabaena azotica FACHB-119]
MAEEPNPKKAKIIKLEGNAQNQSKLTQVGSIEAENVYLSTDVVHIKSSSKAESPGVLKAGNPGKSLEHWQGRETEYAQIQQWLTDKNTFLIGIEGIGGIGKSTLATKIYEEIAGFPKRFWADVSNGVSFSDLARQVLGEFGFPIPEQEAQLVEALVRCLRSGQFLLIIDNLESLLQPNRQWGSLFYGEFFQAWIESGANSKVLVTTRERPELIGFEWLPLKGLQVDEGVALLSELGIRGNLAEFVELVDGHPLLLKLVAGLLKYEYSQDPDLKRLADLGLGNLRQLLTNPQVVGVHRSENVGMKLVLDASLNRLNKLQKDLLLNISVYRGVFDSAAAVAVLPGNSESEIERELRDLVKRSLLEDKLNGKQRFEFQPVVLEYVQYKAGDQTEAHQRAIYYYLVNVKQKPWQTKEDIKEYLEVFYHWYQLEKYDSAFDVLAFCDKFLSLQGYYTDQVELYEQLVSKWEEIGDRENWNYWASLTSLGNANNSLGQYQRAIELFQQSLKISRNIGDRNGEGATLIGLGNAYNPLGKYQQAIEFFQQSLEIFREIGDRNGEGATLIGLGNAYNSLGRYELAIESFEQSLELSRDIGDHNNKVHSLIGLGNAYHSLGEYKLAIESFEQALEVSRNIGARNSEGNSLIGLGNAYNPLGEYQRAIKFFEQSLEIFRKIGDRKGEGNSLNNLGIAHDSLGEYQRAIDFYQQSREISKEIGDRNNEGHSLIGLGNAYGSLGQYQQAIDLFQQSLEVSAEIGDIRGEAEAWFNLGVTLENVKREADALGAYRNACELYQKMRLDADVQDCNNAIERLSQPKKPVVSRRGFWWGLRRLWRWVRSLFRR